MSGNEAILIDRSASFLPVGLTNQHVASTSEPDHRPFYVSDVARAALVQFVDEDLDQNRGEFVRIGRAYQCGGSRFQLTVDESLTAMDTKFTLDDETYVVIEETTLKLLNGCTLDYQDGGFVFLDALSNYC